jgi:hypothetical protein
VVDGRRCDTWSLRLITRRLRVAERSTPERLRTYARARSRSRYGPLRSDDGRRRVLARRGSNETKCLALDAGSRGGGTHRTWDRRRRTHRRSGLWIGCWRRLSDRFLPTYPTRKPFLEEQTFLRRTWSRASLSTSSIRGCRHSRQKLNQDPLRTTRQLSLYFAPGQRG